MEGYPIAAVERAMKVHEVILQARAKKMSWIKAAEVLGIRPRTLRRWKWRMDRFGLPGLVDRRRRSPSLRRVPGTAIADAVRLAVRSFDPDSPRHRVLVLLTDGEDHEGDLAAAAEEAAEAGVMICGVGIGTTGGSSVPQLDAWGRHVGFRQAPDGSPVLTRLERLSLTWRSSLRCDKKALKIEEIGIDLTDFVVDGGAG